MPKSKKKKKSKSKIPLRYKAAGAALIVGGIGAKYLLDTGFNDNLCKQYKENKTCDWGALKPGSRYDIVALFGHTLIRLYYFVYDGNGKFKETSCTVGLVGKKSPSPI